MIPQDKQYEVSAPALHAARTILRNFTIAEVQGGRIRATEKNLGIIIDVCTGLTRVEKSLDNMLRNLPWTNKDALANNLDMLKDAIKAVDIARKQMPSYASNGSSSVLRDLGVQKMSSEQARTIQHVSTAIQNAKTPEEEQKVLRAAGIIR